MQIELLSPDLFSSVIETIPLTEPVGELKSSFDVRNPATGDLIARVPDCGVSEARSLIDSAANALLDWRGKTGIERSEVMQIWHRLVVENIDVLASLLSLEQGKTLEEAKDEVLYGASYIEWFAEEAKRVEGDIISPPRKDQCIMILKEAVGVVCAITPWNFPVAMITRKVAPALAAGCTIVCKPAAETPLSAIALQTLAERAGVPRGVFQVVVGLDAKGIGREFSENPAVRKLTFTGSTRVGKLLVSQSAGPVRPEPAIAVVVTPSIYTLGRWQDSSSAQPGIVFAPLKDLGKLGRGLRSRSGRTKSGHPNMLRYAALFRLSPPAIENGAGALRRSIG